MAAGAHLFFPSFLPDRPLQPLSPPRGRELPVADGVDCPATRCSYSMCRSCVSRIMRQLVAAVADSVAAPLAKARLKGADLSQLHLDVLALQATLRQYDGTPSCWAPVINRISTLAAATGRTPTKGRRSLPTPGAAPKRRTLPTPGGGAKGAPANPRRGSRDAAASAKTAVLSK